MINLKRVILVPFLIVCSNAINAPFVESAMHKDWQSIDVGSGTYGSVFLSIYDPKLIAYKELGSLEKKLEQHSLRETRVPIRQQLAHFTNEICANHEFFGSPLITASFGAFLSKEQAALDEKLVFAMEPMLGGNLEKLIGYLGENPSELSISWMKFMIARVALGIDFMHRKGWMWQDATPKNIFLHHETGYPRIGDFGESKREDDFTSNPYKKELDWADLGSLVISEFVLLIKDHMPSDPSLSSFERAVKALSGPSNIAPGEVVSLNGIKELELFKDFDWEAAENGTMVSAFIPRDNVKYLKYIYKDNQTIIEKISASTVTPLNLLDVNSVDGFILGQSLLAKINEIRPAGTKEIASADDYCEVMDPRRK